MSRRHVQKCLARLHPHLWQQPEQVPHVRRLVHNADRACQGDASPLCTSHTHASNNASFKRLQHSQALAEHPQSSAVSESKPDDHADASGMSFGSKRLAPLADGAATVSSAGTTLLATVVCEQPQQPLWKQRIHHPFLEVDYQERFSAAGRIPHNAQRRELGPSSTEIGRAQSVQCALEPLFAKGFAGRCQVNCTLLSSNGQIDPEPLAINAASAAVSASDIPWMGPIGAVRVAKVGSGKWVVNPSLEQQKGAALSLLYAGTHSACTLLEIQGKNLSQEDVETALERAQSEAAELLDRQESHDGASTSAKRDMPSITADAAAFHNISRFGKGRAEAILQDASLSHAERTAALQQAREALEAELRAKGMFRLEGTVVREFRAWLSVQKCLQHMRIPGSGTASPRDIDLAWEDLQAATLRDLILKHNARPDGRGLLDLRGLEGEVGILPVVHGSALVSAGSSQVLSVVTVGSDQDGLSLETALGLETSNFISHFTCPSFAVNEMKARHGHTKKVEVEGASLLRMALSSVLPRGRAFPFAVRLTSDVLADDGAAAMTAVSSATLALASAGIPLSAPVAGVTLGLMTRESGTAMEQWELVADTSSLEEDLGPMQLHAAGTAGGFTALQLVCNRPGGVPLEIVRAAVTKAAQCLPAQLAAVESVMAQVAKTGNTFGVLEVGKDNLRRIIGPQGSVIKGLEADSNSRLSIDDAGLVHIYSPTEADYQTAVASIEGITGASIKEGSVYKVKVVRLMDYGAFVELPNGFQALLHISELANERVKSVEDILAEGDVVNVMCIGRDARGHVKVSRRALLANASETRQSKVSSMLGMSARS